MINERLQKASDILMNYFALALPGVDAADMRNEIEEAVQLISDDAMQRAVSQSLAYQEGGGP